MRLVLDASVAIKLYIPEEGSDQARSWLREDVEFSAPDIFLVEVAQALLRHLRERRLSSEDLDAAMRDLIGIVAVPLGSSALLGRALAIARDLDHRLHDCMYLALAERLGCAVLTADGRLVRKVRDRAPGLSILSIEDPDT